MFTTALSPWECCRFSVIIGGGGIQSVSDALMYKQFGADHVSVSTLCFNPYKFMRFYNGKF